MLENDIKKGVDLDLEIKASGCFNQDDLENLDTVG